MFVDPEASFSSLPVAKGTEGRGPVALELEAGHPPGCGRGAGTMISDHAQIRADGT